MANAADFATKKQQLAPRAGTALNVAAMPHTPVLKVIRPAVFALRGAWRGQRGAAEA